MDLKENAKKVKIGLLAAALMLCAGVLPALPGAFWILLSWTVCGASIYGAANFKNDERVRKHFIPLLAIAVLFNPFVPVLLPHLTWLILYLATAVYFLALSKKF